MLAMLRLDNGDIFRKWRLKKLSKKNKFFLFLRIKFNYVCPVQTTLLINLI